MTTELAKELEFFETPEWAVDAIFNCEIFSNYIVDPCCGKGILSDVAKDRGHKVLAVDIHSWGYSDQDKTLDFLSIEHIQTSVFEDFSVLMNPPFSKATEFVEHSFELGARKIVCFQRLAWWESKTRQDFWQKYPPNRVYICGNRATCWRGDIAESERTSGTTTAHAWFVWENGHPPGTVMGHVYK